MGLMCPLGCRSTLPWQSVGELVPKPDARDCPPQLTSRQSSMGHPGAARPTPAVVSRQASMADPANPAVGQSAKSTRPVSAAVSRQASMTQPAKPAPTAGMTKPAKFSSTHSSAVSRQASLTEPAMTSALCAPDVLSRRASMTKPTDLDPSKEQASVQNTGSRSRHSRQPSLTDAGIAQRQSSTAASGAVSRQPSNTAVMSRPSSAAALSRQPSDTALVSRQPSSASTLSRQTSNVAPAAVPRQPRPAAELSRQASSDAVLSTLAKAVAPAVLGSQSSNATRSRQSSNAGVAADSALTKPASSASLQTQVSSPASKRLPEQASSGASVGTFQLTDPMSMEGRSRGLSREGSGMSHSLSSQPSYAAVLSELVTEATHALPSATGTNTCMTAMCTLVLAPCQAADGVTFQSSHHPCLTLSTVRSTSVIECRPAAMSAAS